VILSLQLSFAVIPLVYFTGQRSKMGEFVNSRPITILAWTVAMLIVGVNTWLVFGTLREWLT
jgi:manganese transport protein